MCKCIYSTHVYKLYQLTSNAARSASWGGGHAINTQCHVCIGFLLSGGGSDVEALVYLTLSASSWIIIFAGGMLTAAIISTVIVIINPRRRAMIGLGIGVIYSL